MTRLILVGGGHCRSYIDVTEAQSCPKGPLTDAEWLEARVVNLPSSVNFGHATQ